MNIIVLSLSLVSLASAAGSAEREIIARQARKIQSQADEIKALKKADMRRRLLFFPGFGRGSDSESDSSDGSSDGSSDDSGAPAPAPAPAPTPADIAGDWCGFVSDYTGKKDATSDGSAPAPAPAPAPSPVPPSIGRCSSISSSDMDRVPAFKLFVDALKDNPLYNGSATVNCITCSLKNIYEQNVDNCNMSVQPHGRIEQNTTNPLVVMAPNTWLNDPGCLRLIDPNATECDALENCVMPVPAFQDLQVPGGDSDPQNDTVYTAEAVMAFFGLNLTVSSFNFILSQYMEYTDNPVVFSEASYANTEVNFNIEKQQELNVLKVCVEDFDKFCKKKQEMTIDVMTIDVLYNCLQLKLPVDESSLLALAPRRRPPTKSSSDGSDEEGDDGEPLPHTQSSSDGSDEEGDDGEPLSDECAHELATYEKQQGDKNPPPSLSAVVLGAGQQKSLTNNQRRRRLRTQIPNGLS